MPVSAEGRNVIKRDGSTQPFDKTKILNRVQSLVEGLNKEYVTLDEVVDKVATGLYDSKYLPSQLYI